jgi:hypothetical protein
VPSSPPPCGCRIPFGKAVPYVDLRIITEGAKYPPTGGACCVPIAATTEKVPRCQRSLLLVDVRSFWEIAAVVVMPEVHPLGLVVAHLSPQHGYLIHAMRQRSMPGSGLRILALAGSESAEGSIGFPEVNPRSHPGLLYLHHSPYLPTFPPHHLTLPLLRDLSTHISAKPTSI